MQLTGYRCAAVLVFFAALTFLCATPAYAASTLTGIQIGAFGGGARVTLSFAGGVPQQWRVDGNGSAAVVVRLPGAQQSSSMNQLSYAGVNSVTGASINNSGSEIDVTLQLAGPAQVKYAATFTSIVIDVPRVSAVSAATIASPGPAASGPFVAAPSIGGTAGSVTQVLPLRYADVSEVGGILGQGGASVTPGDTFVPSGSIFSLPTQNGPLGTQAQGQLLNQQQPQAFGQRIDEHVAIDRRLNAVILTGTRAEVDQMRALVEQLDVPISSVMLECEVIELSQNGARDVGLDFTTSTSGPVGVGAATLGSLNNNVSNGAGNVPAFTAEFGAKLFATITNGGGRILASPRVLAQNGVSAQILTGDALPIISTTTFPGPPVTTQTNVSYIAVGVNLQIQPRISDDGNVTSHIFAEVSSVTAEVPSAQGPVPQISLRQASTTATVKDGTPFVIGGLLKDEEIQEMSKLPILGDLPIIGPLFRVVHNTNNETNLYVIITPHVIDTRSTPPSGLPQPRVPGPIPKSVSP